MCCLRGFIRLLTVAGPQVRYEYGVMTNEWLKELGADVTFKTYRGMGHQVGWGVTLKDVWP